MSECATTVSCATRTAALSVRTQCCAPRLERCAREARGERRERRCGAERQGPRGSPVPSPAPWACGLWCGPGAARGRSLDAAAAAGRRSRLACFLCVRCAVWRFLCASPRGGGRRGAAGRPGSLAAVGSFCVETVRVCLCTLGLRRLARMIRFFAVTDHFLNRQGKLKPNSTSGPRSRTSKRTSQTHTRHQKQTPQRSLICKSTHAHPRRELWSVPSLLDECSERP